MSLARPIVALALAVAGCGATAYACNDDASCQDGSQLGTCEPSGGCSFPDVDCASGRRYGSHAPGSLAGECVPADGSSSGDPDSTGSVTTTFTTTTDASTTGITTSTASSVTEPTDASAEVSTGVDATTDITQGPTTSPTDTGPADDTTTANTTDPQPVDPYGSCMDADCLAGSTCEALGALPLTCAPGCEGDRDCPPPQGGAAVPRCVTDPNGVGGWCVLPCNVDDECPPGMFCTAWEEDLFGDLCTWF